MPQRTACSRSPHNVLHSPCYITITLIHPCLIAPAIELNFLQALPGDVVNEDEGDIILPIMMKTIPSTTSLPSDVVVNISVAGGTATSKNIIVHTHRAILL